jgi:hypothetical protein
VSTEIHKSLNKTLISIQGVCTAKPFTVVI